jgi:nicotinamide-nucleotide amidase
MVSEVLIRALEHSGFVIITGGLGSTEDDMTSEIAARALNRPLALHRQMFELIKHHLEARGMTMTPSFEKMAWMPDGSQVLNPGGTSCGFSILQDGVRLYFLPGVPDQMRYLMDKFVIPEMLSVYKTLPLMRQRILRLYGIQEPAIADVFTGLRGKTGEVLLGFYPCFPENHITLNLRGQNEEAVTRELDRVEGEIRRLLGAYIFAGGNESLEEVVGRSLAEKGLTIAVAESCTGGMVGHRLTNVPGSTKYFLGGVVAYHNAVKSHLLRVAPETIERHGAVSGETAREMASGAREVLGAEIGLSVTGIAGPGGGSRQKPVGTVFLALAGPDKVFSGRYRFWGTRDQVRLNASTMALDWVRRYIDGDPFLPGL